MTQIVPLRLAIRGLSKSFGGVQALSGADLSVRPGEIHGLLGKNGSGKSTLIKILSGFHAPDAGELLIDGKTVPLPMRVGRSEAVGLAFVHQNLGLLGEATVLENLIAGNPARGARWWIDWRTEAERAKTLFEANHLDIDPHAQVSDLSPVKRAQLAIVRASDRVGRVANVSDRLAGVLILDEPTPFLPIDDVRELFAMMRRLAARGVSIIFVSHDIDEVIEITDRATILRDGYVVDRVDTSPVIRDRIVEAIVGRTLSRARDVSVLPDSLAPALRVRGLSGRVLRNASFDVAAGEILGLTGLIGSGYDEVPYLISGAQRGAAGQMQLGAKSRDLSHLTPTQAIDAGIALIPADRQRAGLALELTLTENLTLPLHGRRTSTLRLAHRQLDLLTLGLMRRFQVKAAFTHQRAADLSGGNQQKLLLAKWLQLDPILVVLDEPTQGIDVGARREIYSRLTDLCATGAAIICASSEFEQLEMIAHRVLVFERGRIKAELTGDNVTKTAIANACYEEKPAHAPV